MPDEPRPLFCAYCGDESGNQQLCKKCLAGLDPKYIENNRVIVEAYVRRGFAQMEHYLTGWALFGRWLREHHID